MNLLRIFARPNPGRELSYIGHAQARSFIRSKTREMREEMGLEPDARQES
jgi:hypothetical protein